MFAEPFFDQSCLCWFPNYFLLVTQHVNYNLKKSVCFETIKGFLCTTSKRRRKTENNVESNRKKIENQYTVIWRNVLVVTVHGIIDLEGFTYLDNFGLHVRKKAITSVFLTLVTSLRNSLVEQLTCFHTTISDLSFAITSHSCSKLKRIWDKRMEKWHRYTNMRF
jgi:hypothetical protein